MTGAGSRAELLSPRTLTLCKTAGYASEICTSGLKWRGVREDLPRPYQGITLP